MGNICEIDRVRIKCIKMLRAYRSSATMHFSKQLYLTRFWFLRSMDRRECDTHISTHARVVRIVVVAVAIENIPREESVSLLANKSVLYF